jgi:hypothetical protein
MPLPVSFAMLIDQVRSLSTVPARSTSRVSAGVLAGAAVAGFAAYESTSSKLKLWAKPSSADRWGRGTDKQP